MPTQYLSIAVTVVDLLALVVCIGALACRFWLIADTGVMHEADAHILLLWQTIGICVAALTLSSIMLLFVRTAVMSERPLNEIFPVLSPVIFRTHFGKAWMIRFLGLGLAWLGWLWSGRSLQSRIGWGFMLVAVTLIAASRSASGHAADAGDFTLAEVIDWLHIFATSVWGGALVVTSLVISPAITKLAGERRAITAIVACRLSLIAGIALASVVMTGLFNAWRALGGDFTALWSTAYGQLLSAKLLLVAGMVSLGAINRYRSLPLLRGWAGHPVSRQALVRWPLILRSSASANQTSPAKCPTRAFTHTARIEVILVLGVVLITAVLLHAMPVH
ncbi:MAG: CopD family protein [Gammaproteobacteria bacterium]|nr:CopD family protein [Gammaproteobacteria bacterium]